MDTLHDKVAVVTGAASGLGLAMARRFAADGAHVVLADVHEDQLREVADDLAGGGTDVLARVTDVADPDALDELAAAAVERFGAVHVLCNNAGVLAVGPAWEISPTDWRRVLDVNLGGVVNGVLAFVPDMVARGEPAHVVNTASMAGVTSLPGLGPYVASKHAVVGLSEVLHHDLAAVGAPVGVSVLLPGYVPTRLGMDDRTAPVTDPPAGRVAAADVADRVVEAILEDRFYVFTHPRSTAPVDEWAAAVHDGMRPAGRPVPVVTPPAT